MGLIQYETNYFINCFRLNLPDSEYGRLLSGIDTRAVNLQGLVTTIGGSGTAAIKDSATSSAKVLASLESALDVLSR